jgi:Ser/Thr protein kinase RdoA (MazF antagonist)
MPQLIQAIPPEPSIDGALLMEYLSGSLLTAQSCTDALAYTIGATLAKMHMHRLSGYGDLANPKGWHTDPRIYFNERFEGDLHECRPHLSPAILQKCRAYHDAHLDLLLFVDGPCITHRDFRPGNIIVDNRHLKGIIDWSGARASFAQEDFCAIEYGGWHTVAPEMKPSLLAGYKSVRPIPEYHAIMPLLQLNRALATIGFLHKRGIWDSTQKRLYTLYRQFLEDL